MGKQMKYDNSRYKKGLWSEYLAMILLTFKGYEVLAHRFGKGRKGSLGEIDLIAKKGKTICFIEIKYRKKYDTAAFSISQTQKQRIRNNALFFIKQNEKFSNYTFRFDAFLFSSTTLPKHLKNVF
ncbi:MAG: YraN family protein [Rickettsiales bacterium]|jgi:putative endonuclease|nr:YraN family protein [Rickettsiales bacterium]